MNTEKLTPVPGSSHTKAVGHDGKNLWLQFAGGALYSYEGAPAEHVAGIIKAASAGKYFNEHIRGKFPHTKAIP